jgi:hypothetical protein
MMKHLEYHHLVEAMHQGGCPVCYLLARNTDRYMRSLLYESVNDPGVRKRLREAGGLCNLHAWRLKEHGDGLGQSILYEDLLSRIRAWLLDRRALASDSHRARGGGTGRGRRSSWKVSGTCPVCVMLAGAEERILSTFVQYLEDDELARAYKESFGLCAPHLLSVMTRGGPPAEHLLEIESDKLGSLIAELKEFQRKNDYRYAGEGFGPERDSWIRAIEKVVGGEGIA